MTPTTRNIKLVVDTRERDIARVLLDKGVVFESRQLDIGDFIFEDDVTKKCILLIERKTVQDLKCSICDGRSKEQKMRIIGSSGLASNRVVYLIEGSLNKTLDDKLYNIRVDTLVGSIVNTMFRDGMFVYKTMSVKETGEFIRKLYNKFLGDENFADMISPSENINNQDITSDFDCDQVYASVIKVKKKTNMTPSVWFMTILNHIPQVSTGISSAIVKKYETVQKLCDAYKSCQDKEDACALLSKLVYPIARGTKERKIGPAISKRIYLFVTGQTDTDGG